MVRQSEVGSLGGAPSRGRFALPLEVEQVFREFRTTEFSTLARDGAPIAWPLITLWQPEEERFVLTTSIGLPRKAFNVRRDGRVSLLFSDPTASGLEDPPAVLVQGDAEAPDEIKTSPDHLREYCTGVGSTGFSRRARCTAPTRSHAVCLTGITCASTST